MTTSQLGSAKSASGQTPPLESGDRLTRPEFERRYAAAVDEGIIRNCRFPGLWLAADAMLSGDMAQVLAVLQTGLQSPEHQDSLDQLLVK
jgi:hypothetical protein